MAFASKRSRTLKHGTQLSETQLEQVRGGAAQAQPKAAAPMGDVMVNPLYQDAGTDASNPLFGA